MPLLESSEKYQTTATVSLQDFSEGILIPDYFGLPLVSITDPDIACHHGGNEGTAAIASAPAGSQVVFQWVYVTFSSFVDCVF
jgi:hypothetical protein